MTVLTAPAGTPKSSATETSALYVANTSRSRTVGERL